MNALRSAALPKSAVRSFSTSVARSDLARVQLIGRLGAEPTVRTAEKTGAPYIVYPIATATGAFSAPDADGRREPPPTSWHSVWCFNEKIHDRLTNIPKGSTVFVEADLTMKDQPSAEDGSRRPPIAFLMHRSIQVVKSPQHGEAEEGTPTSSA